MNRKTVIKFVFTETTETTETSQTTETANGTQSYDAGSKSSVESVIESTAEELWCSRSHGEEKSQTDQHLRYKNT